MTSRTTQSHARGRIVGRFFWSGFVTLRRASLVSLVCAAAPACGSAPTEPSAPYRELRLLGLAGPFACQPSVRVVEAPGEWQALTAGLTFDGSADVDFGTDRVVLASLGSRPTSGYSAEVQDVRRRAGGVVLEAVELTPGRCPTLAVVTCPGAIVVIPRSRGVVSLDWGLARPRAGCQ